MRKIMQDDVEQKGKTRDGERVDRSRLTLLGALSAAAATGGCNSSYTDRMDPGINRPDILNREYWNTGSFKVDGTTYIIKQNPDGTHTYQKVVKSGGHNVERFISKSEYDNAAKKRDALKTKKRVADGGGEGGGGGGGGHAD